MSGDARKRLEAKISTWGAATVITANRKLAAAIRALLDSEARHAAALTEARNDLADTVNERDRLKEELEGEAFLAEQALQRAEAAELEVKGFRSERLHFISRAEAAETERDRLKAEVERLKRWETAGQQFLSERDDLRRTLEVAYDTTRQRTEHLRTAEAKVLDLGAAHHAALTQWQDESRMRRALEEEVLVGREAARQTYDELVSRRHRIQELEAQIGAWADATGCSTPEKAQEYVDGLEAELARPKHETLRQLADVVERYEHLKAQLEKERACHDCREYRAIKEDELAAARKALQQIVYHADKIHTHCEAWGIAKAALRATEEPKPPCACSGDGDKADCAEKPKPSCPAPDAASCLLSIDATYDTHGPKPLLTASMPPHQDCDCVECRLWTR